MGQQVTGRHWTGPMPSPGGLRSLTEAVTAEGSEWRAGPLLEKTGVCGFLEPPEGAESRAAPRGTEGESARCEWGPDTARVGAGPREETTGRKIGPGWPRIRKWMRLEPGSGAPGFASVREPRASGARAGL